MRDKILHSPINLLVEPGLYQDLRRISKLTHTSMSKIIRDGMRLILAKIDKEHNAVMGGQE